MWAIDRDLVKAVNSGRCFAIIGSGPSCEMGVPSWRELAQTVIRKLTEVEGNNASREYTELLDQEKYPAIFSLAQQAMGREGLLEAVQAALQKKQTRGTIYEYAAKWPFASYLTTNFDDYLAEHLEAIGVSFVLRRNSTPDMQALRAGSRNLIVKIHGDVTVPDHIVLTEEQYAEFQRSESRAYWRNKITAALHMIDFVVIGYSASDPDFKEQLERAQELASPDHPVFMFAADLPPEEIAKYYQNFNIRVIPYKNMDGRHQELVKLFKRYDPFIAKRQSALLGLEPVDEGKAALAASMHLFTQMRLVDSCDTCIERIYACVILQVLSQAVENTEVTIDELRHSLKAKTFAATNIDPTVLQKAFDFLHSNGFAAMGEGPLTVRMTNYGREEYAKIVAERALLREKFQRACELFLKRECPEINALSTQTVIAALDLGLVKAYEKRGMEIARSLFSDGAMDISGVTDVLDIVNRGCAGMKDDRLRASFADLMLKVMLNPEREMKEYLAVLAQGYFAFHALGLDPNCSRERLEMARAKLWILDSSVVLPALAICCENHAYAKDLLRRMRDLGFKFCITERLFSEVRDHANWAIRNFETVPPQSPIFLQAATAGPGFKHNLFLEGYLKWSLPEGAPSLARYMVECLGDGYKQDLTASIRARMSGCGIGVKDFAEWSAFTRESWPDRDSVAQEIGHLRKQFATYRSEDQCLAEAEVVLVTEAHDVAFLSQSTVLDKVCRTKPRITWNPEAMYRFLALFSAIPAEVDLLYSCMTQDFYYAGFSIVDNEVICQYVSPQVRQARMKLDQEKMKYTEVLGEKRFVELRQGFENVPDEQKPFYSIQFAFYAARQAMVAAERSAQQERENAEELVEREVSRRRVAEAQAREVEEVARLAKKDLKDLQRLRAKEEHRKKKAKKEARKLASRPKRRRKHN